MQYRLYNKIGKKYFSKKDYKQVFLTPTGRVKYFNWCWGVEDITDQVIVEQWTEETDVLGVKIFHHDRIEVRSNGELICVGEVCWENGAWQLDDGCMLCNLSNYTLQVIGTIHDESEASQCE